MTVIVRFDAEIRLLDDETPETLDYASITQAVQDVIGHTGATIIEATEWTEE